MTVLRLEHIGIVVDDLAAATAFFAALGLESEGEASVEGGSVDRINGLEGVRADIVILRTPDGNAKVELAKYRSPAYAGDDAPAPANAPGIRHILFVVDDIQAALAGLRAHGGELVGELENYANSYWLCYVRGPAGIIVELAQRDRLMGVPAIHPAGFANLKVILSSVLHATRQPRRAPTGHNDEEHHRAAEEREFDAVLQDGAIGPAVHEPIGVANVGRDEERRDGPGDRQRTSEEHGAQCSPPAREQSCQGQACDEQPDDASDATGPRYRGQRRTFQ